MTSPKPVSATGVIKLSDPRWQRGEHWKNAGNQIIALGRVLFVISIWPYLATMVRAVLVDQTSLVLLVVASFALLIGWLSYRAGQSMIDMYVAENVTVVSQKDDDT